MKKIYISAGAGSGKTYTITTDVAELIKEGKLQPEKVIMTTYTKAAAQELREKTKKQLAVIGKYEEALQMDHALIGTVQSVANTFLRKYWYLLGIMPDACAMEEDELDAYRKMSMKDLLTKDERKFMFEYCEKYNVLDPDTYKLNYEFWKADLCKVLDYMTWYKISDEQLDNSKELTRSIIDCLKPTATKPELHEIKIVHKNLLETVKQYGVYVHLNFCYIPHIWGASSYNKGLNPSTVLIGNIFAFEHGYNCFFLVWVYIWLAFLFQLICPVYTH